jgi:hypothetical protein
MARQKSEDKVRAHGIGLKDSEWSELEKIAEALGVTAHAAAVYAIRYFMRDYKAGTIKTQTKKIQTLPEIDL